MLLFPLLLLGSRCTAAAPLTAGRAPDWLPRRLSDETRGARERSVSHQASHFLVTASSYSRNFADAVLASADVAEFVPPKTFVCVGDADDALTVEKSTPRDVQTELLNPMAKLSNAFNDSFLPLAFSSSTSTNTSRSLAHLSLRLPPMLGSRSGADISTASSLAARTLLHNYSIPGAVSSHPDVHQGTVHLTVLSSHINLAANELVHIPWVHFVEPIIRPTVSNANANAISQSGTSSASNTPVWNAGYTGAGSVAGCGDTGVDTDNCYFNGKDKVKYTAVTGDKRDQSGHGTHVAGTLIGNSNGKGAEENGVAKDAKLSFMDLQSTSSDATELEPPIFNGNNFKESYLDIMYSDGALISSHSFGIVSQGYDIPQQDFDWFAWDREDALAIAAAGNRGIQGFGTVNAPASSKNTLAVGATLSSASSEDDDVIEATKRSQNRLVELYDTNIPPLPVVTVIESSVGNSFSESNLIDRSDVPLVNVSVSPASNCGALISKSGVKDSIAIGTRSEAFVAQCGDGETAVGKVAHLAADAGARAYLHVNDFEVCQMFGALVGRSQQGNVDLPAGHLNYRAGYELLNRLKEGSKITSKVKLRDFDNGNKWDKYVASFSSKGLLGGQRIKPDVMAPGDSISSAEVRSVCGLKTFSGTSMAAPNVAGSAVLARQFLSEEKVERVSGSLLSAVLMNGAEPMLGSAVTKPSSSQNVLLGTQQPKGCNSGYGRINLQRSLGGGSIEGTPTSLEVVNNQRLNETGQVHRLCLDVDGKEELRVTLVYHDHPGSLLTRFGASSIVNDLQLSIGDASGTWSWPKARIGDDNNERVIVPEPTSGRIQVNVSAERLVISQSFSLAMTGKLKQVSLEKCYSGGVDFDDETTGLVNPPPFDRWDFKRGRIVDDYENGFGENPDSSDSRPSSLLLTVAALASLITMVSI